jgi:hypothetical protein
MHPTEGLLMATITRDCPHCKVINSAFGIRWAEKWIRGDKWDQVAVAICGTCALPICFKVTYTNSATLVNQFPAGIDMMPNMTIGVIWPLKEEASVPRHLPPDYEAKIREAENAYRANLPTAAAGLYRALVDTTTKRQLGDAQLALNGTLMARIERLAENHVIPKAVADWAHEVRTVGNEGLHEEMVVTLDDATMTRNFAQTYLRYAFELPGDIAARRAAPRPA